MKRMKIKTKTKTKKRMKRIKRIKVNKTRKYAGAAAAATALPIMFDSKQVDIRIHNVLQRVCKSTGDCLALGMYNQMIYKYFDYFSNLALVDNTNVHAISEGNSGIIIEIPFVKNNYVARTIMKTVIRPTSDNLTYEYYVGKHFINTLINIYPCFIETYDLYNGFPSFFKSISTQSNFDLINQLEKVSESDLQDWGKSCAFAQYRCLLVQHFNNLHKLSDVNVNEIASILYQVYYPLHLLGNTYTHYDLHADNILLYKPFTENKYVQMHYHLNDGSIVSFPCTYIVKIIDYGRNYFRTPTVNSYGLISHVCTKKGCPHCGYNYGYSAIQGVVRNYLTNTPDWNVINKHLKDIHYVNPIEPNESYDLRLAYIFSESLKDELDISIQYEELYGTPPGANLFQQTENVNLNTPVTVGTVHDMEYVLRKKIPQYEALNNKYADWIKGADLHVYPNNKEYVFTLI